MRTTFKKPHIKCAFREWLPQVMDFGDNKQEEAIEAMWRHFLSILLKVAEAN